MNYIVALNYFFMFVRVFYILFDWDNFYFYYDYRY
jgi:hypothetical protein